MGLPKKIKGAWIFSEVIPQLIPEIDFYELLTLGTIVGSKNRERVKLYESFHASLRKIQWVKFASIKAMAIIEDIRKEMKPDSLLTDPIGLIDYSLSITDFLIHTKSCLDSMAIFLTDLLGLDAEREKRDLKRDDFREKIKERDSKLGRIIDQKINWLLELQAIRNEWIHRSAIRTFIISGPSEVDILPIPKEPSLIGKLLGNIPINTKNFWSASDFVKYHYSNLINMFNAIIETSIRIEKRDLEGSTPIPDPSENYLILFPIRLTESMIVKKLSVMSINLSAYFQRLSNLFTL